MFFKSVLAQQDTTILSQDQLRTEDILPLELKSTSQRTITTFQTNQSIQNTPYTAYIVTKGDIRRNDYTTLTDVLSQVPGVFVSPIGSASEGELFMMRGLRGNRYTEIMVNGMSIKPMMAAGMPLAAQVPIRQAERIEIIQGTSSAEFGFGANAGIINIILKDSERPIFTQADLSVGDFGYTNIDVMFGGKLGRGDRVLKFSAWGSSTVFNDWNLPYQEISSGTPGQFDVHSSFIYDSYYEHQSRLYQTTANYRGTPLRAVRNSFPHQSRQFGLRFQYKKLDFGIGYRNRRDHAALGMNPLALGYHNSSSFKGEQIPYLTFVRKPGNNTINYRSNTSLSVYLLDRRSSQQPIQNYVAYGYEKRSLQLLKEAGIDITPAIIDSIRTANYLENLDNERYDFGFHYQVKTKHVFTAKLWNRHQLLFGFGADFSAGLPEVNYLVNPVGESFDFFRPQNIVLDGLARNINTGPVFFGNFNTFLQTDFNWNKFNVSAGTRLIYYDKFYIEPRGSLTYRLNPNLTVRASIGLDHWFPNPYFDRKTYAFDENLQNSNFLINPYSAERTLSIESGVRWKIRDRYHFDITYFATNTSNLLRYDYRANYESELLILNPRQLNAVGYFNFPESYKRLGGVQAQIELNDFINVNGLKLKLGGLVHYGVYNLTGDKQQTVNAIEDFPNVLVQASAYYKLGNDWFFSLENVFHFPVPSVDMYQDTGPPGFISNLMIRYNFSENFGIYAKGLNILNSETAGISATETPDALYYNPQPLFRLRLGANYRME